ncbi:zinc-binding dehydrogenase, partial [Crossiella equi]
SVLVQLGRALGAHVTALASAPTLDLAVSLGAHEALDYRGTGPSALGAFDVVVDAVGTELAEYHRLVRPGGRFVALAPTTPAAVRHLAGSFLPWRERALFFSGNPGSRLFADLTSYVESGAVRPVVDTVFPLEEVAAAHHALARGGVRGKYVIRLR